MRVVFIDFDNRANDKDFRTTAKELTPAAVARILQAQVPTLIASAAEAIIQKGTWIGKTEWKSPSGNYSIEIVADD